MDIQLDLRYTLRLLRKSPGFSCICLLVVILGVTTSLIAYAYVNALFYKAPPFPEGDRFVVVNSVDTTTSFIQPFVLNGYGYNLLKANSTSFSELGAFEDKNSILSDGGSAQTFRSAHITPNLMEITQQQALLGRNLRSSDADEGTQPVALIGYNLWQSYYAADPEIVGKTSRIDSQPYTIVGVMPEQFRYPLQSELWLPLSVSASTEPSDITRYGLIGLLDEQASIVQANSEVNQVFGQLSLDYPDRFQKFTAAVAPYVRIYSTNTVIGTWAAIAVVVLVLAWVNLSSLLLLRSSARHHELVVRSALGAGRWQLAKQILLESFLLCSVGTIIAIALADFFLGTQQAGSPYNLRLDAGALMVAILITASTWLIAGSFAAYRACSKNPIMIMDSTNKGGASRSSGFVTNSIVGIEVTLSCFLLVICTLLAMGIYSLQSADLGTKTEGYIAGQFRLTTSAYDQATSRALFLSELEAELIASPAVTDVGFASLIPGQFPQPVAYDLGDVDVLIDNAYPRQNVAWTSNNYFELMQVPLLEGRSFDESDTVDSQAVVIVDELFAQSRWPGESAIGKQIRLDPESGGEWLTVVGVASHLILIPARASETTLYMPATQNTSEAFWMLAKTATGLGPSVVEAEVRAAAARVDRDVPIENFSSLAAREQAWISDTGTDSFGPISIALASITLVLAIIGIYGVVSRSVTARTNEIGVRRALGSSNRNVISLFLKQGSRYLLIGVVIGGGAAAIVGNTISALFPSSVGALPLVLLLVTLLIGMLITIASYVPARTAVTLEPGEALHYE